MIVGHARLRNEALAASLRLDVVGTSLPDDAVARVAECDPDIVIVEVVTAEDVKTVAELGGRVRVLAVGDEGAIRACAIAGMSGFATLDSSPADIEEAVEVLAGGGMLCSRLVAAELLRLSAGDVGPDPLAELTHREREVLAAVAEGLHNKQIAARLGLELQTIKNHMHNIIEKLGVGDRGEAAAIFDTTT